MAGTKAWLSSRPLWASITFVLALICLVFVIMSVSLTNGCMNNTCYDPYRWKSRPTIKHEAHNPAMMAPTVKPELEYTHLTRRDMSNIPDVGVPSSPTEDKPVQADDQALEGHHDPEENQKKTQPEGSEQVPDDTQKEETVQKLPESESKSLSLSESDINEINSLSLPTQSCLVNGDCGSGYQCYEGWCYLGCDKHQDCPKGYQCDYGRWGYRCFTKKGPHRECREHLAFCTWDVQCCSGVCGRRAKGKALLCWPKGYPVIDQIEQIEE
jgi:hypothetical protein